MKHVIDGEVGLNRKYIEMVKLLTIYLNHFPKHEKYALALNIRQTAYTVYDLMTECQKRYFKKTYLTELEKLSYELKTKKFVQKHSMIKFKKACKKENINAIASLLGHAKGTNTMPYFTRIIDQFKLKNQIPTRSQKCLSILNTPPLKTV